MTSFQYESQPAISPADGRRSEAAHSEPVHSEPPGDAVRLSESARRVIGLFEGALAGVGFPSLDLATLQAQRARVQASQASVEAARDALEAAMEGLREEVATLEAACELGLAYATVYASTRPELEGAVRDARVSSRADSTEPTRRRMRSRKDAGAPLLLVPSAAE